MKQTLAILTEGKNSAIDWVRLFKDRNCKLLIYLNCNEEIKNLEQQSIDENVSYQPCAKEAAWEADLLLIETGIDPLPALLRRLSGVAANKVVLVYSNPQNEEEVITKKILLSLPYSTIGVLKTDGDDFIIHLINSHNLTQARTILNELNFPFTEKTKINEQNY